MIRRAKKEDIFEIERLLYQVQKVHADIRPDIFRHGQKKYTTEELYLSDNQRQQVIVWQKSVVYWWFVCRQRQTGKSYRNKAVWICGKFSQREAFWQYYAECLERKWHSVSVLWKVRITAVKNYDGTKNQIKPHKGEIIVYFSNNLTFYFDR